MTGQHSLRGKIRKDNRFNMDAIMLIEIFGYIGSALIVVSMLMSSVVKLRIINTIGSIVSAIYAVICGAFPLALMNLCLIFINLCNLFKLLKTKQEYDLIDGEPKDAFVKYFLDHYKDDIKKYFPGFDKEQISGGKAYVVCCDGTPAGMLLGKENGTDIDVMIDYSIPKYRDCSVGRYLYSTLSVKGIQTLTFAQTGSDKHVSYMDRMGFVKREDNYIKQLYS